jgi:hypothetical protein
MLTDQEKPHENEVSFNLESVDLKQQSNLDDDNDLEFAPVR